MGKIGRTPNIVYALAGFMFVVISANVFMVWLSGRGHRDLVRPDYYAAGLEQDKIIARNELAKSPGMDISFKQDSLSWKVEAGSILLKNTQCKVRWYRPDNGADDWQLDLGTAKISGVNPERFFWQGKAAALKQGEWVAHLVWEENGKPIMEKTYPIRIPG